MKKWKLANLCLSEDEAFELAYYTLVFFNGWEGRSSTAVYSNKDHSVYYYTRVLPGLYKEIRLFTLTGIYARQLWALECYQASRRRLVEQLPESIKLKYRKEMDKQWLSRRYPEDYCR